MRFIQQYLSNRKHRLKDAILTFLGKELFLVSILGLLILNIFLCDLFYFLDGLAVVSYTENITHFSANKTKDLVIKVTQYFFKIRFQWFQFIYMRISSGLGHILFSVNDIVRVNSDTTGITSENKNDLLDTVL